MNAFRVRFPESSEKINPPDVQRGSVQAAVRTDVCRPVVWPDIGQNFPSLADNELRWRKSVLLFPQIV
ncbi:hypothetical protein TNIN_254371 [Trichonephila inaurata madagascariensis]|uniref:Uncharacterized protein n=1 Tax=Trichonephila inaurata madagascariensis TaxID=2747483 RepID=A0A8X6Y2B2_9ARAC|nr:hypothetical protein TNIN_254371 [Trichonephila inaurata madagascariensis]